MTELSDWETDHFEERTGKFCEVRVKIPGYTRDWRRAEIGWSGWPGYKVKTYFLDDGLSLTMTPLFEKATETRGTDDTEKATDTGKQDFKET